MYAYFTDFIIKALLDLIKVTKKPIALRTISSINTTSPGINTKK